MREPWKTLVAVGSAILVAVPLGYLWFYIAVLVSEVTNTDFALRGADVEIWATFFLLTLLFLPYSFLAMPVMLAFLFHRAISSGDVWGALKAKRRIFLLLFGIGLFLALCFWLSGTLDSD